MSGSHLPLMEEGMARWPFGPPNAGIALDFVGAPPALDELRALVEERWKALPRLTQILVAPGAASRTGLAWWTGRHRWASRDGHDLAQQVDSADATLRDAVRQWFHTPFPAERPPWSLHLLRGATEGEFSLLFRMHHSLLDGRSLTTLLRALLDDGEPLDGAASLAIPGPRRRMVSPGTTAGGPPGLLTTGRAVPLPHRGAREHAYTVVALRAEVLRAAREAVRTGGAESARPATTNEVFLATVSGVLRACLSAGAASDTAAAASGDAHGDGGGCGDGDTVSGARQVWLSVPVDERPDDCGEFLGNAFANVRVPAPVTLSDPTARLSACTGLLTTVTRPRRTSERLVEGTLAALPAATLALAGGKIFAPAYAPAACSYVHLRERGRTLAGRPLRHLTIVPMVPPADTATFALGGCTQGHTLSVATNSGSEDAVLLAERFLDELSLLAEGSRRPDTARVRR
ncbi:wax ester/triacylglycerol synthase domain-containing protein [Streptomyces sp. 3214.6]|uniref:wax ester/triacylglycerol synthase domain-containing protein n=1 Tax=Streptomyces sp. 3214.6 TaxID=1882757 RepID=UPI00090C7437|nr:wax ester/triacylglycerol synthase domain-containing protein [Streptomyces sp. 3214.6]SHI16336.1 Wax ester synthase-like Acyl-CoA acyltransferase domain-containing protein [Streptomyces sp. 3214.6]